MSACLDDALLAQWVTSTLPRDQMDAALAHVDTCEPCHALVAGLARAWLPAAQDGTLGAGEVRGAGPAADQGAAATFGRYLVLRELGRGGIGVVHAAYDPELDREVAIKIIAPESSVEHEMPRDRLVIEARAMARLRHPNVVTVHDVGKAGGIVFVAMELLEQTLHAWLGARARPAGDILAVFREVALGLAAAHDAGIVHRDFKPSNVMFDRDGRPKVTDFGLAAEIEPASSGGGGDVECVVGTPAYMAPEQFDGLETDARADIFAFCVALFEALYGVRPFAGRGPEARRAEIAANRVRAAPERIGVAPWVIHVLERGLRNDPAERYGSMSELLDALDGVRTPVLTRPRALESAASRSARAIYARARAAYHSYWVDGALQAVELLESALALVPDDPAIAAALAQAHLRKFAHDDDLQALETARGIALRAVARAPERGEPHVALALLRFHEGDGPAAAASLADALSRDPDLADAQELAGRLLVEAGAVEEGTVKLRQAAALEPLMNRGRYDEARTRALLGDDAGAAHALGAQPSSDPALSLYWFQRTRIAQWKRDVDGLRQDRKIVAALSFGLRLPVSVTHTALLGEIDPVSAQALFERFFENAPARSRRRILCSQLLVDLNCFLGRQDAALDALAVGVRAGLDDLLWLDRCPLLDDLRAAPAWPSLHAVVAERCARIRAALGASA